MRGLLLKPFIWYLLATVVLFFIFILIFQDAYFVSTRSIHFHFATDTLHMAMVPFFYFLIWAFLHLIAEYLVRSKYYLFFSAIHFFTTIILPAHIFYLTLIMAEMDDTLTAYRIYDRMAIIEFTAFLTIQIVTFLFLLTQFVKTLWRRVFVSV
jgi:hypothetical protein